MLSRPFCRRSSAAAYLRSRAVVPQLALNCCIEFEQYSCRSDSWYPAGTPSITPYLYRGHVMPMFAILMSCDERKFGRKRSNREWGSPGYRPSAVT